MMDPPDVSGDEVKIAVCGTPSAHVSCDRNARNAEGIRIMSGRRVRERVDSDGMQRRRKLDVE